jgi:hypothetical protein
MRLFRFGLNICHARSRAEFIEKARKVEALGYDRQLTLPDHLTDRIAPMPALSATLFSSRGERWSFGPDLPAWWRCPAGTFRMARSRS